jgi:hypothetical protein
MFRYFMLGRKSDIVLIIGKKVLTYPEEPCECFLSDLVLQLRRKK